MSETCSGCANLGDLRSQLAAQLKVNEVLVASREHRDNEVADAIEESLIESICLWLADQEDQDGCGDGMVAGIRAGKWKR